MSFVNLCSAVNRCPKAYTKLQRDILLLDKVLENRCKAKRKRKESVLNENALHDVS